MFTALVVTRLIFDILARYWRGFKRLPMLQFFPTPSIKFTNLRKLMFSLSIILIIIGSTSFILKGEKNFGIDFSGGSILEFEFGQSVNIDKLRDVLEEIGYGDRLIQEVKGTNRIIIRSYREATEELGQKFKEVFGIEQVRILRVEKVGPVIGKLLRKRALFAIIYSLIGISLYIFFRFKHLKFAVGAIIALFHDVLICAGALSLTARELSLPVVAALLTIVGYSINDTIVIYSRIRENLKLKKDKLENIINISTNQVLSRSLLTSLTTLLVVVSLYVFGGEVINDFAFVLLVGIIAGTYSSIFIAAPCLITKFKKNK
jgi:preprotein translocase SecF subunit